MFLLVALAGVISAGESRREPVRSDAACPTTPTAREAPPRDSLADPFGEGPWYVNPDRSIWGWHGEAWVAGKQGNKVLWIRPRGSRLLLSGRRLDRPAPLMESSIPGGYASGFQSTGLYFPSTGCWEIRARAGPATLTFVTRIDEARDRRSPASR